MAGALEPETFSPPPRTDATQVQALEAIRARLAGGGEQAQAEPDTGPDVDLDVDDLLAAGIDLDAPDALDKAYDALAEVEMELELAQKQRELLTSIEEQIKHLPIEEQAEMLKHVSGILNQGSDDQEKRAEKRARDLTFASDFIEILSNDAPLSDEERATLRPMAIHVLETSRGEVPVQTVFAKIPELYEDVVEKKVELSNMELVALACSSGVQGLEVASRKELLGRLSSLELMALLCDSTHMVVEAVLTEAPQLAEFQPEHLAIFRERNRAVANEVLKIPYVRRNLSVPLEAAMKHWESTNDPLDLGEEPKKIERD
jgi:hypothetical protein